jgi:hypothetical protein
MKAILLFRLLLWRCDDVNPDVGYYLHSVEVDAVWSLWVPLTSHYLLSCVWCVWKSLWICSCPLGLCTPRHVSKGTCKHLIFSSWIFASYWIAPGSFFSSNHGFTSDSTHCQIYIRASRNPLMTRREVVARVESRDTKKFGHESRGTRNQD